MRQFWIEDDEILKHGKGTDTNQLVADGLSYREE